MTLAIAKKPSFCSALPPVEGGIQMCIRSLSASSLYIDRCFRNVEFIGSPPHEFEKQMTDVLSGKNDILERSIALKDPNIISVTVQAMCAQIRGFVKSNLAQSLPDAADQKRNKIAQSKLVEATSVLPQLLDHSSFKNVFNLAHRFTNIGFYLLEGMRHQHEKPTPSLMDVRTQDLDYETDIEADRELMSSRIFPTCSLQSD
ncbi:unnamed protein product [Taenia asiatica]|uniref:NR LBD domain-containing protein n=1 Tax=Taenia asiatica TaxID=60517 RepID=A0A0R3WHD2_TAEAS|nr:unnamed protein product [Taenia asiatica]